VVGQEELWAAFRADREKRAVRYFRLAPSDFGDQVAMDSAQVKAYYQEHQDRYQRPAQTKVRYVVLSPENLAEQFEPTDEALRQYLENNAARYTEEGESTPALADIRDRVATDWRQDQAVDEIYDRLPTFKDLLYTRDTLDAAAEEFGLSVKTSAWIPAEGKVPSALPQAEAFREKAFATQPGRNSRAVELDDTRFAGLHVLERRSSEVRPFEAVRDRVRRDYRRHRAKELAEEKARALRETLAQGGDMAGEAEAMGRSVTRTGPLSRERARSELPSGLGQALFAAKADAYGTARVARTDWAVFQVTEVVAPERDTLGDSKRQELAEQIRQQRGQARLQAFFERLRQRYEVKIRK
jgi:peptidyl-prolyl cis-trans isomerase D